MKKQITIMTLLLILVLSFSFASEARSYLTGMYLKESDEWSFGREWYGIGFRSLGGIIGSDLDLNFYFGSNHWIGQLNPFIHLNLPLGIVNIYAGASPLTLSYFSALEEFKLDFHLFYLKAGAQIDLGRIGIFAHGMNMLDIDDIRGSIERMVLQFGLAIGF